MLGGLGPGRDPGPCGGIPGSSQVQFEAPACQLEHRHSADSPVHVHNDDLDRVQVIDTQAVLAGQQPESAATEVSTGGDGIADTRGQAEIPLTLGQVYSFIAANIVSIDDRSDVSRRTSFPASRNDARRAISAQHVECVRHRLPVASQGRAVTVR